MNSSDISSTDAMPVIGENAPREGASPAVLWGVIGALAVSVAALGGVLIGHRGDSGAVPATQAVSTPLRQVLPQASVAPDDGTPPPAVAAVVPAPVRAPVCASCGRVESVQTVRHAVPATGVGAVAGGVLGGVLGNQIGHGGGRAAATVLGAVGGGYAGHVVEGRVRTETRYQVRVRMADGSMRTVETRTAPPLGKPVTLRNGVLRPADGRT
ncbi:MAG: glycine zipper 2TM domain-containing protein [Janthinobacterium lividum]